MSDNFTRNVGRYIYLLNARIEHLSELKTDAGKVDREQLYIIEMVSETPEVTQKELVGRLKKKQTSVSRSVQRLVDLGYLTKNQNSSDMRAANLEVTDKAEKLLESVEDSICNLTDDVLRDLNEEEQKSFASILQKIHL